MERLLTLAEDGRSFLSSELAERATDVSWSAVGENVTCICGSYCSQAYCVIDGRLMARETGDGTAGDWRAVDVECNAVFAGRSAMVVQSSEGNAVRSSFDPFHPDCPQISAWEVLPFLGGAPVTSSSRLLLSPRDHVIAVGGYGEVHLLRDTWIKLAPAPEGTNGGPSTRRGFLGRAKSFLQSLRRGKGRRFPAAFLGPNCLWVSSLSQPCVYRLGLEDLDSASLVNGEAPQWASFRVEGGVKVTVLAGSVHRSDMFWGIDESGGLFEYTVDYTEGDMCVRPHPVGGLVGEGQAVQALVDVSLVTEVLESPFQSTLTLSGGEEMVGEEDSEEEFVEAQGVSSLPGHQKLAYRYCCEEGDCDACRSMATFRSALPTYLPGVSGEGAGVSVPGSSPSDVMLQWRKRPDPPQLASPSGSSKKRKKTLHQLNDHQVSGVEVAVSTGAVVRRAHQVLANLSLSLGYHGRPVDGVLSSVGDLLQDVMYFARNVLDGDGDLSSCKLQVGAIKNDRSLSLCAPHSWQLRVEQAERQQVAGTQSEQETPVDTVYFTSICNE